MENLKHFSRKYAPGINLSWLTCPLEVDAEVGSHYGILKHVEVHQ
jgi:hypothetical protein